MLNKLHKLQKSNTKGFTIIEVMIVLAIAGLILLIVFLAVPAVERNSRNTARKTDAGRVSASIANYISDAQGVLPTAGGTGNWTGATGACLSIENDAGSLSQYTGLTCTQGTQAKNDFDIETGSITPTAVTGNELIYVVDAVCGTVAGSSTVTGATAKNSVLLYSLETGSGNWNWSCIASS